MCSFSWFGYVIRLITLVWGGNADIQDHGHSKRGNLAWFLSAPWSQGELRQASVSIHIFIHNPTHVDLKIYVLSFCHCFPGFQLWVIWCGFQASVGNIVRTRVKYPLLLTNYIYFRYNMLRRKFPATSFTGSPVLSDAGFDLLNKLLTYDPAKVFL